MGFVFIDEHAKKRILLINQFEMRRLCFYLTILVGDILAAFHLEKFHNSFISFYIMNETMKNQRHIDAFT